MADNGGNTIRVFILDDHEMIRRGVRDCLNAEEGIEVVGEAATGESAIVRVPLLGVDVAILDVRLAEGDGIQVCREIRSTSPDTACLMLTGHNDDEAMLAAIMAGAAGYVTKLGVGEELVEAVRTVASGRSVLGPDAAQRVMARIRAQATATDPLAALGNQEKRVLELIGEGLTNREIAGRMFLSEKTVKNYVSSLLAKLGMQRRSQVAALAARVLPPPELEQ
jgi:DNA-binding NarL/FixJ family response regulator